MTWAKLDYVPFFLYAELLANQSEGSMVPVVFSVEILTDVNGIVLH